MKRRALSLEELYLRQRGLCGYCKRAMTIGDLNPSECSATRDHVVPKSTGGKQVGNLKAVCRSCNIRKGSMTVEQFRSKLRGESL